MSQFESSNVRSHKEHYPSQREIMEENFLYNKGILIEKVIGKNTRIYRSKIRSYKRDKCFSNFVAKLSIRKKETIWYENGYILIILHYYIDMARQLIVIDDNRNIVCDTCLNKPQKPHEYTYGLDIFLYNCKECVKKYDETKFNIKDFSNIYRAAINNKKYKLLLESLKDKK